MKQKIKHLFQSLWLSPTKRRLPSRAEIRRPVPKMPALMPLSPSNWNHKDTSYLGNRPQGNCDILLKLDDGSMLPAHSQVLASLPVFAGMLEEGLLSSDSATNDVSVPFSGCSVEEACQFLSAVYSCDAQEHINNGSALSIARLSNKYGEEVW